MKMNASPVIWQRFFVTVLVGFLAACASAPDKPKPTDLGINPALMAVRNVWSVNIGAVDFALSVKTHANQLVLASTDGTVLSLDAKSGATIWRSNIGQPISAGVGSDGQLVSVVTRNNELVTLKAGQPVWRVQLPTQVFTAPLLAGGRVFVLGGDRSVAAFDAQTGQRLWHFQRTGESLVLRQSGVLSAVGNTLIAGLSGHLLGLNPLNGTVQWDAAIATPRGTNEIERLVDLVEGISRAGKQVCVRAFQSKIGCVDTNSGRTEWTQTSIGYVGLSGDDQWVYGVESDAQVRAYKRSDGAAGWQSDRLRYHVLTRPLVIGRSLALGDDAGWVHLMSRSDGSLLTRVATDGSALVDAPVQVANTLIAVTRKGGVFGFQPE
jgi:outer membrane assembly lipoprotein YfgL